MYIRQPMFDDCISNRNFGEIDWLDGAHDDVQSIPINGKIRGALLMSFDWFEETRQGKQAMPI